MKKWILLSNKTKEEMDINKVFERYERLVYDICKSWYTSYGEDIQQEGFIGLTKAFNTYKIEKGMTFTTYATIVIRNEIYMYNRRNRKNLSNLSTTSNDEFNFEEMIVDKNNLEKSVVDSETLKEVIKWINAELGETERKILKYLYLGETQKNIAEKLNISSQGYISKVKKKILNKANKKFGKMY